MHVRQVPEQIFRELAPNAKPHSRRDALLNGDYVPLWERRFLEEEIIEADELGAYWLHLREGAEYTHVGLYPTLSCGLVRIDPPIISVVGGKWETGTWGFGLGNQLTQGVSIDMCRQTYASQASGDAVARLRNGLEVLALARLMTERVAELLESGTVDLSTYFQAEIGEPPASEPRTEL